MKMRINLTDILDLVDYDRASLSERIQVCRPDGDWDDYDEVLTSSTILIPLLSARVKCMEAIDRGVIRVEIDWAEIMERWIDRAKEE